MNKYLLGGTLAAARSQHKRFCRKYRNAASADGMHRKASVAVFIYFRDKRQGAVFDIAFVQLILKPLGVFRTGELLAEVMKTETVVNALLEYSSEPCLSFKKENLGTVIVGAYRRRKSGRAAADNEYVIVNLLGGIYILDCLPEQRIYDKILAKANEICKVQEKETA